MCPTSFSIGGETLEKNLWPDHAMLELFMAEVQSRKGAY